MANNVGNISIGLSLDNQSFEAVLSGSASRLNRFTGEIARSGMAASAASGGYAGLGTAIGRFAPALQQTSFMLQDFTSQLSSRGVGGGLSAAANNIQMLGSAFGPMGLAVSAGLGVAVGALGAYIEQSERAAKKTADLEKGLRDAFKRIGESSREMASDARVENRVLGVQNGFLAGNATGASSTSIQEGIREDERKLKELKAKRQGLISEFNKALPREWRDQGGLSGFASKFGIASATEESGSAWAGFEKSALRARVGGWERRPEPKGFLDATQRITGIGMQPTWFSGKGKWLNPLGIGATPKGDLVNKHRNLFTPESVEGLGKLQSEIQKTNTEIERTIGRATAASRGLPGAIREDIREDERQKRIKELEAASKVDKDSMRLQDRIEGKGSSFLQGLETSRERLQRRLGEVDQLQLTGGLTPERADEMRRRLQMEANRQPNSLPSFAAGSQETLSAINRIIRGTRDSKAAEATASNTAKAVTKLDTLNNTMRSQTKITVARF